MVILYGGRFTPALHSYGKLVRLPLVKCHSNVSFLFRFSAISRSLARPDFEVAMGTSRCRVRSSGKIVPTN
jgi:hypothetical protein